MGVPELEELRRILLDANNRESARLQAVRALLPGLVEACDRYAAAVTKRLTGSDLDLWPGDAEGAQAVVTALNLHPAFSEGSAPAVVEDVFDEQGYDPAEFDTRREVADFIVVGVSALVFEDLLDEETAGALVLVAAGADTLSRLVRDLVLGGRRRGLDFNLNGLLPQRLIDPETLEEGACAQGIQGAVLGLAAAGQPGRAWAKGIRRLHPADGCTGDKVVIRGTNFGAHQPAGVVVMFPGPSGGTCVPAKVTAWKDTAVTVTVPKGVGVGCVGFAEPGKPLDVEAASTFAGVLESCLGPAAFNIAEKVRHLGGVVPAASCPGCLPGKANYFEGGAPAIDFFTANLGHDVVVEPDEDVVLRWSVRNSGALSLTRITQDGPSVPATTLSRSGTLNLGPFSGNQPAAAAYALVASNGCGIDRREVTVQYRKIPKLKIDSIEVVQVIQRPDNSVRLVAQKRTVARVFVDSGLTDTPGFDFGAGPNVVPHIVGNVVAYPVARGFGTAGTPLSGVDAQALPATDRDRANAAHSLNVELPTSELFGDVRLEAQVAVAGHESDVGGPYKATLSTTVAFSWQPAQYVVPMLVADTLRGIAAPTLADFNASLQEARKRYPLGELNWIVVPTTPIALDARDRFGNSYDLAASRDWQYFLYEIQMMLLLGQGAPTGAVRTAIVPNNFMYAIAGTALTRQAPTEPPALICQAGLPGTYAHEFGHTCGFSHAPCPPLPGTPGSLDCMDPPDTIDPRLPGRTDEVGFDVPAGVVIEKGRGEMMSYCGDESRCPGTTRWPSITGWDLLFDTLPAR
jgi:hypothetical protein